MKDLMERRLIFDGQERHFWVYVPKSDEKKHAMPVLMAFHGFTSNAMELMRYADFRAAADEFGLLLVYAEGTLLQDVTHWNVGGWTNRSTTDDVGFVRAMLDALMMEFAVDEKRVYATGHSNGGFFSLKLACELSERFAAVASVSGSMTPEMMQGCRPSHSMPVLQIHGEQDPVVRYGGTAWSAPVKDTLAFWQRVNGCDAKAVVNKIPRNPKTNSHSMIEHVVFENCEGSAVVEHYKVIGGGHEWLNSINNRGEVNWDVDTVETIVRFLIRYSLD